MAFFTKLQGYKDTRIRNKSQLGKDITLFLTHKHTRERESSK